MDLKRTKAALLFYDLAMPDIDRRLFEATTNHELQSIFKEIEDLGAHVGEAYARDVAKPEVAKYVRPDAWLRGLVALYGGPAS